MSQLYYVTAVLVNGNGHSCNLPFGLVFIKESFTQFIKEPLQIMTILTREAKKAPGLTVQSQTRLRPGETDPDPITSALVRTTPLPVATPRLQLASSLHAAKLAEMFHWKT